MKLGPTIGNETTGLENFVTGNYFAIDKLPTPLAAL